MQTLLDVIVVLVIAVYVVDGYRQGFVKQFFDLIGIVLSFLVALKFYAVVGTMLATWGLDANLTKPIGFFILWTGVQVIFYIGGYYLFMYLPDYLHYNGVNKSFGLLAGLFKGTTIVSIFLILMMVLPIGSDIKEKISGSYVAGHLVKYTAKIETQVSTALWQMNNSLGFIGQVSNNGDSEDLGFKTNQFQIDETSEASMLEQVNNVRKSAGLDPLMPDILLRNVARAHSMDMVMKGYFSHIGLNGESPSNRLTLAGADFRFTGENLALAPSMDLAFIGLMNSEKHRENVLDENFRRIGIGVIDVGTYGKMFTQVFTD